MDGGTKILPKIYYHSGLDIGGSEADVRVIAATDALVVSVGDDVLEGHREDTPVAKRYDVVYLLDNRGWYYRYSHLHNINDQLLPPQRFCQWRFAITPINRLINGSQQQVSNTLYCRQNHNHLAIATMVLDDIGTGLETSQVSDRGTAKLLYQQVALLAHVASPA